MDTRRKLIILADAAKCDASCAPSGTSQQDSADGQGVGIGHRSAGASIDAGERQPDLFA